MATRRVSPKRHGDQTETRDRRQVEPERVDGALPAGYDLRRAAPSYATVVGTAGSFVVTAVILVFTVAAKQSVRHPTELALTAGLLVVGLVGCLAGAFALGSISGEQRLTANLPAAGMRIGTGVLIAVVAIIAAFEALSAIYLPESKFLFVGITAGTGAAGVIFNALVVVDAWQLSVGDDEQCDCVWLKSRVQAYRWMCALALGGLAIVAAGAVAYTFGVRIVHSEVGANRVVAVGIIVVLVTVLSGVWRTTLTGDGRERPLRKWEAVAAQTVASVYVAMLVTALP